MPFYKNNADEVFYFAYELETWQTFSRLTLITEDEANALIQAKRASDVPQVLTRKQARQALILVGLFKNVKQAIDSIPDETQRLLVQVEWDDSDTYQRDNPTLMMLASALGLSSEALDQLFIKGATL